MADPENCGAAPLPPRPSSSWQPVPSYDTAPSCFTAILFLTNKKIIKTHIIIETFSKVLSSLGDNYYGIFSIITCSSSSS